MSVLAVDAGGTRIKLGWVEDGTLLGHRVLPAQSDRGLAGALPRVAQGFRDLANTLGRELKQARGIGLGLPLIVNSRDQRVLYAYGKYLDAPDLDLPAWARDALGLPLRVENDARLALLGEWRFGAGEGSENLAIITLGTGIGSAVLIEGRVLRGAHFQAGNLCGHLQVQPGGRLCICGGRGCVEAETGSAYLPDRLRQHKDFASSRLAEQNTLDYKTLFRCAREGDRVAREELDRTLQIWGMLCVNLVHAFDLDRIVIGGGIMASARMILPDLQACVDRYANTPWGEVSVLAARHPDHMALLGCETLFESNEHPPERT